MKRRPRATLAADQVLASFRARAADLRRRRAALAGELLTFIAAAQEQLARLGGGAAPARKRRHLSPEARAKIVAAQKRRWAKVRAAKKDG